jgi:predicted secreted protein
MEINGQGAGSSQARDIALGEEGSNTTITIRVTPPNGNAKTYSIVVERAARAGNNNLSALTVSPGTLAPPFSPSTTQYAVDVGSTVTSVTVTAVLQDTTAGMEINGQGAGSGQAPDIALGEEGSSTPITIRVTPPNANAKTYTITIERGARAGNNNLQSLAVSPGSLTPAFTAARTRYTVDVESPVTSVMVTAALQDTTAGMEVNGQGTSSGQSREISLGTEGSSTAITIRVIPPNGNAKTYTITVNRASSGDSGNDGGKGNKGGNGNNGGKGNKRNNGNKGDNGNGGDGGQSE